MARVLIVDDDAAFRESLAETLDSLDHEALVAPSGRDALAILSRGGIDAVFLDFRLPLNGLDVLRRHPAVSHAGDIPVVMLTAYASADNTIEAIRLGAFDHLAKPVSRDTIARTVADALRSRRAAVAIRDTDRQPDFIVQSEAMRDVVKLIGRAAASDATVLITGETGSGKEEVARALHRYGTRAAKPFVAIKGAIVPVGGEQPTKVNVRVLVATHRNLVNASLPPATARKRSSAALWKRQLLARKVNLFSRSTQDKANPTLPKRSWWVPGKVEVLNVSHTLELLAGIAVHAVFIRPCSQCRHMVKRPLVPPSPYLQSLRAVSGCTLFCLVLLGGPSATAQELGQDGKVRFNGLLQAWYTNAANGLDDTFRIRRAELKFSGEILPAVTWVVMVDPAKMRSVQETGRILQDAFITLEFHQRLKVSVGQLKVPLSLEGLESSAELDTERALFMADRARGGAYGDIRDIGVMASGPLTTWLDYQLGFFDSSGDIQNALDRDDRKAVAGRLVYRPAFVPGLQVGTSGVRENGAGPERGPRNRLGADLLYLNGPLTLKTEYMTGKDVSVARKGYYAQFAYELGPTWEAVLRYDTWDPDTHLESVLASVTERDYVAGFNYFIDGHRVKLQFNYLRKTFDDDIVRPFHQAALRLQTSW
jgi:CheY-like chemotaxis protein